MSELSDKKQQNEKKVEENIISEKEESKANKNEKEIKKDKKNFFINILSSIKKFSPFKKHPYPLPPEEEPEEPHEREEKEPPEPHKIRNWIIALLVSFFTALIPIAKILPRINTAYIGGGELEGWLWRYWWMKQLLASLLQESDKNYGLIIYTYLTAGNYPETGNVFDWQTFSMILEPIFGDPAHYNIKVFLILFLNGIAGYALCKYLTRKPIMALVGGIVLILNPYVVYEIANGRTRQAMLFTMPLFILYLMENFSKLTLKSALLCGFWLGVTSSVYLFYGMSALFFGLIFLIYNIIWNRKELSWTFLKYVGVIIIIFILISGTFAFRYIEIAVTGQHLPEVTYLRDFPSVDYLMKRNVEIDPRDPLSQSLLRYRSDSASADFPFIWRYKVNIPLIVTLLLLVPLFFLRPVPWLWVITFSFFYLLSLGPYLMIGTGHDNYIRIGEHGIPLLYVLFFKFVPFFARLFAPIRMMGMMYVSIIAILTINLSGLVDLVKEKLPQIKEFNLTFPIPLLLVFMILFQMNTTGQLPIDYSEINVPSIYYRIAMDREQLGIIEVPFRIGDFVNFYQIYHGKKVLWGWSQGSIPSGFNEYSYASFLAQNDPVQDNTFIKALEGINQNPDTPLSFYNSDVYQLKNLGYKYIVLHERGTANVDPQRGQEIYDNLYNSLSSCFGNPMVTGVEISRWDSHLSPNKDGRFRISVFSLQ